MKQFVFILILGFIQYGNLKAQIYNNPIAAKQSHPELEITQIEVRTNETIISLKVTNKRTEGGWFCADKNIYIKNSKGIENYELIKSENIPTCPDQFEFAYSGQSLEFKLYFPPISDQIKFIDFIESCNNACFSFYGIILDNEHNEKIRAFEKGFELYQEDKKTEAIPYFEKVTAKEITLDSHIYGLSFYYLTLIYFELENQEKAEFWYNNLINSNIEDKNTFIKELEKSGIKK
ncbi:MAG: hypothetical protein C0597_17170 [Marinilabiliales bacterium]|nr:MAG: hypothetical protein C0597_17170 [Marinilabiliales bacterium]